MHRRFSKRLKVAVFAVGLWMVALAAGILTARVAPNSPLLLPGLACVSAITAASLIAAVLPGGTPVRTALWLVTMFFLMHLCRFVVNPGDTVGLFWSCMYGGCLLGFAGATFFLRGAHAPD